MNLASSEFQDPAPTPSPAPQAEHVDDDGAASTAMRPEGGAAKPEPVLVRVLRFNEDRKPRLVRLKLKRMAQDHFSFFRGANHLYADAWPDLKPPDAGPEVPICGDLHLENFGAYRDDDGELRYDINDFDEAVVAPCSVDLVRCATSILLAAELWRLTPLQASGMVLTFLESYRSSIVGPDTSPALARGPIREILGGCALAGQSELLARNTERARDGTRRIVRSKDQHPALKPERAAAIRDAVESYGAASGRAEFFQTLDVTGRVAGIGSLGVARHLVLIAGGGTTQTHRLFDLKECRPSALGRLSDRPWPFPDDGNAARVVRAQRMLQLRPTAGLDVVEVGEDPRRFREMIPAENRSSLDRFRKKPRKLRVAIEQAGLLTALSHRRGAGAFPNGGGAEGLARWASGPALDSVLAAAARFAERTRLDHRQFRAQLRSPQDVPAPLRKRYRR